MFKKFVGIIIIGMLLVFTGSINKNEAVVKAASKSQMENFEEYFSSMDTRITVTIYKEDDVINEAKNIYNEIKSMFEKYHELTNNFVSFENVNNIKYINENPNVLVEVEKELYDMLIYAEEIKQLTDGYFDISIGRIIDRWKWLINLEQNLSNAEFDRFVTEVKDIPIVEDGVKLESISGKHYVTIKDGVKLDLGALSKGYAVARANEILKNKGSKYYRVTGSFSSLQYGKKPETDDFTVGISSATGVIYGYFDISNRSITTSGDTAQGVKYGNRIYHHIVSPKTKMPENHNRLITLVHEDAGYADAITTALFSMDDKIREEWLSKNGDLEYVLFKTNGKVINELPAAKFRLENGGDIMKTTIRDWLIISAVIIIAFLGFYMISKAFSKLKYEQAAIIHGGKIVVLINFDKKNVEIVENFPLDEYNGKKYPSVDYEKNTITVMGDFAIDGVYQEMIFEFNFEKHSMQAISETSPKKEISKMGISTGKDLISIPYNIIVRFGNGKINTDDTI